MGISVLIVEDNPLTSQDLAEILVEQSFDVAGVCASAEDALIRIPSLLPDVLLVDIQLKGEMTGIDLVNRLTTPLPVVYLTANSDRETVTKVLATHPASFLTKPFNEREVVVALTLAVDNFNQLDISKSRPLPFVFLKSGKSFEKVNCDSIDYVQAAGSYCQVHTERKEYVITGNLNTVCQGFNSEDFIRVHRSYMINVNKIESMDHDYLRIAGKDIPIGRTYKDGLKNKLIKFV